MNILKTIKNIFYKEKPFTYSLDIVISRMICIYTVKNGKRPNKIEISDDILSYYFPSYKDINFNNYSNNKNKIVGTLSGLDIIPTNNTSIIKIY